MDVFLLFEIGILFILFVLLAWSANATVHHLSYIGNVFRIRLFLLGILLGLITSLPELLLGLNAVFSGIPAVSVGSLLGGGIVILGFILGASLLLGRKIVPDGGWASVIPIALTIFSPILLGWDGVYGFMDGFVMIALYCGLIFYLQRLHRTESHRYIQFVNDKKIAKSVVFALVGIAGMIFASHWIMNVTFDLLQRTQVSHFVIGLIIFAIGTNLPEISVAITSFFKKTSELSLSHLLSSSFSNIFVLGFLAILRPLYFDADSSFLLTGVFLGSILMMISWFYSRNGGMHRREGMVLLFLYFTFVITSIFLQHS